MTGLYRVTASRSHSARNIERLKAQTISLPVSTVIMPPPMMNLRVQYPHSSVASYSTGESA